MMLPHVLRASAMLIAVAAVVDPVIMRESTGDAVVAVLPSDPVQDADLAEQVVRALNSSFTVVRGVFPSAAATVVAGTELPRNVDLPNAPIFGVTPSEMTLAIRAVELPPSAQLNGMIEAGVSVQVHAPGPLRVQLLRDGIPADAVEVPAAPVGPLTVVLRAATGDVGAARFRVEVSRGGYVVAHDQVVDVVADSWRVLFHDGRPSWMSTFVRRTLEQDPRFETSAHVVTSQGVAMQFGTRSSLHDLMESDPHLVIVGAPELLGQPDATALERYMRTAGGTVLLLLDRAGDAPYSRLTRVTDWTTAEHSAAASLLPAASRTALTSGGDAADTMALLRSALHVFPRALPAGARAIAHTSTGDPVIWRMPVGRGELIVSGALDAWRYRTEDTSQFTEFWPRLAAEAAAGSVPPVGLHGSGATVAPEEWTFIEIISRSDNAPSARVDGADGLPVEVHRIGPQRFRAEYRAPAAEGEYRVVAEADGKTSTATLVVDANRRRAAENAGLLPALAVASGGTMVTTASLSDLPRRIQDVLRDVRQPKPWYPMRSLWWLLAFTTALAGEWLWRRRQGLP
jgi:hypothetical protein